MRKRSVFILLFMGILFGFYFGYKTAGRQQLLEIHDSLKDNIRMRVIVAVYEHKYGPLTEKEIEQFLRSQDKTSWDDALGQIRPI